jgi:hypothetical protein
MRTKTILTAAALTTFTAFVPACTTDVHLGMAKTEPALTHANDVDKVDLLFVVDNSMSMADKQDALSRRIPELVRLLTQIGMDPITGGAPKIVDMHVAAITSSLGSQGTSACDPTLNPHADDAAHLLPRGDGTEPAAGWSFDPTSSDPATATCPKLASHAPIRWVLDPSRDPSAELHGVADLPKLEAAVTCDVLSAKDDGCGYEMPLEAMYRFLVDPAPPKSVSVACAQNSSGDNCTGEIARVGVDQDILDQRAAFLRPDSLLAVVLITDESDSSLRAEGENWIPWAFGKGQMAHGFAACDAVPDDVEPVSKDDTTLQSTYGCFSCFEKTTDARCNTPWASASLNADVDSRNLRAFDQVRRYGWDFLYPTSRYVDGLTKGTLKDANGNDVPNPIFAGSRSRDLVVVAGILGAPPRLVNDANGFPRALSESDWSKLISPDPAMRDPHMIESIAPRAGVAHFAGDANVDPDNGGDRDVASGDDLQYACLGAATASSAEKNPECSDSNATTTNPSCVDANTTRVRAYPGIRPLRVIHGVGTYGYVASICDSSYRGAIAGIAKKIGEGAAGK